MVGSTEQRDRSALARGGRTNDSHSTVGDDGLSALELKSAGYKLSEMAEAEMAMVREMEEEDRPCRVVQIGVNHVVPKSEGRPRRSVGSARGREALHPQVSCILELAL